MTREWQCNEKQYHTVEGSCAVKGSRQILQASSNASSIAAPEEEPQPVAAAAAEEEGAKFAIWEILCWWRVKKKRQGKFSREKWKRNEERNPRKSVGGEVNGQRKELCREEEKGENEGENPIQTVWWNQSDFGFFSFAPPILPYLSIDAHGAPAFS